MQKIDNQSNYRRGFVASLLCSALAFAGCGKNAPKPPETSLVHAATVESLDKVRRNGDASYLAIVRFDNETDLSFKVGGILVGIGAEAGHDWDEGTPVKAGTVIAELNQVDFTNALISARARAELTAKVLARFRKLRATDAISQQELDVTEADWRTAQAQFDQAQQNLRDSRLVAAKDGVILTRHVNSLVTVAAGQRVLRFADTSLMSVEVGLPDRLVARLTPGKEVDIEVSGLERLRPFRGRVSEVGVAASGDGRLFRVVVKVPNPNGLLRSGMTARIHVEDTAIANTNSVCVPLSTLITLPSSDGANGKSQPQLGVFVIENGKATKRAVKTGDIYNSSIVVTEGLHSGERVVTSGASFLYQGAPVEVAAETLSAN